jgi:hypothetical protein
MNIISKQLALILAKMFTIKDKSLENTFKSQFAFIKCLLSMPIFVTVSTFFGALHYPIILIFSILIFPLSIYLFLVLNKSYSKPYFEYLIDNNKIKELNAFELFYRNFLLMGLFIIPILILAFMGFMLAYKVSPFYR